MVGWSSSGLQDGKVIGEASIYPLLNEVPLQGKLQTKYFSLVFMLVMETCSLVGHLLHFVEEESIAVHSSNGRWQQDMAAIFP